MNKVYNLIGNSKYRFLVFLLIAFSYSLFFSTSTSPIIRYYGLDAAIFRLFSKGWLAGLIPYVDIFDHKGPVLYLINLLAECISSGKAGIFILSVVSTAIVFYLIFRIARLITNSNGKSFIVLLAFIYLYIATDIEGNLTEGWSLPFLLLPLYDVLKAIKEKEHLSIPFLHTTIYGLCFGIVSLIRINNAAIIIGIIFGLAFLFLKNRKYLCLFKHFLFFTLRTIMAVIPILIYFIHIGAVKEMLYGTFLFNLKYSSAGAEVPVIRILKNLFLLSPCILLCVISVITDRTSRSAFSYILWPMSIITFMTFVFGFGYTHYFLLEAPLVVVGISLLFTFKKPLKRVSILFLILLLFPFSYTNYSSLTSAKYLLLNKRAPYYEEANSIIKHTIPENEKQKIWVYDVFPDYFLENKIIPYGKYFAVARYLSKIDPAIKKEIDTMLNTQDKRPFWIITSCRGIEDDALDKALKNYYIQIPIKTSYVIINLYKLKAL